MFDKQRQAETQTQKLDALGQFAGGIAHDFNNILSVIEGYATLALRDLKAGSLTPQQLQNILLSTQRGASLTRQLLAFARQKVGLDEQVEVGDMLQQQRVLLHPLLGEGISLYLHPPGHACWADISADQFTQIILNLALNARDAMKGKGELAIILTTCPRARLPAALRRKTEKRDYLRLSVIDNGHGIASSMLPHVFDPFFTTKPGRTGTGLGLSVVHGIAEQIGGCIEVNSKVGEGTVFDIYLPQSQHPPEIGLVGGAANPEGLKGRTVLLAEDADDVRDVLSLILSDMQMKVLTASNGNEALRLQSDYEGNIDFLLADIMMPEMDGTHLGDLFSSVRPDANVIYMSGYPFMDDKRHPEMPQGADFISKPFREDKIREILTRALERRSLRQLTEADKTADDLPPISGD